MELHRTHGFPLVICRPGIVIGERLPAGTLGCGMFYSAPDAVLGGWRNRLPLVLVEDVANALVLALDAPASKGSRSC